MMKGGQPTMNGGGQMNGSQQTMLDTKWFYRGPDGDVYGPYTPREMLAWSKSGYFNEHLLVKTENDDRFHPLGEYTAVCGGQLPFLLPSVHSLEAILAANRPPPLLMFPPGLAPPYPPPPPQQQQRAQLPYHHPHHHHMQHPPPNIQQQMQQMQLHPMSQPPSEPHDGASSVSHTPDSDHELQYRMGLAGMRHIGTHTVDAPWNSMRSIAVEATIGAAPRKDVVTQTMPLIIPSKEANRMLTELLGQTVHIV